MSARYRGLRPLEERRGVEYFQEKQVCREMELFLEIIGGLLDEQAVDGVDHGPRICIHILRVRDFLDILEAAGKRPLVNEDGEYA